MKSTDLGMYIIDTTTGEIITHDPEDEGQEAWENPDGSKNSLPLDATVDVEGLVKDLAEADRLAREAVQAGIIPGKSGWLDSASKVGADWMLRADYAEIEKKVVASMIPEKK